MDVLESSRRVKGMVNGEVVAETDRPRILFETGLPARYYLLREDVRKEVFVPRDKETRCPYKGVASYWSVEAGASASRTWSGAIRSRCQRLPGSRGAYASSTSGWT